MDGVYSRIGIALDNMLSSARATDTTTSQSALQEVRQLKRVETLHRALICDVGVKNFSFDAFLLC